MDRKSGLHLTKNVVYCGASPRHFDDFLEVLSCAAEVHAHAEPPFVNHGALHIRFVAESSPRAVLEKLHEGYFNLLIIDLRPLGGDEHHLEEAKAVLDGLESERDIELRYPAHRVMALVGGLDDDRADQVIGLLSRRGVGRVIRDHASHLRGSNRARHAPFAGLVLSEAERMMTLRSHGKTALCCAGGGITGIYFEMGALKCLDDCLGERGLNELDLFYGISAGAVVSSLLANGYSMDELMAAIAGDGEGRIPRVSLSLFRLTHLNWRDMFSRIGATILKLGAELTGPLRGGKPLSLESLLLDYSELFGAPLKADAFEIFLRGCFEAPGATNSFRKLPRPLFIGATDQDLRTAVLFGEPGYEDVPISLAVEGSVSLNPAFSATRIGSRYYEDGGVTRTSNVGEAIKQGAGLVFLLDPLLPYVSKEPGEAHRRGMVYNIDQNIRTMSYTRFEQVRNQTLLANPHVSSYTFVPSNRLRKLLTTNALDHRPYLALWRGGYLSTLQRIRVLRHRLSGDLAVHGFNLNLEKAEAVAQRLEEVREPSLADFFPDGRVQVRQPPLCLAPQVDRREKPKLELA